MSDTNNAPGSNWIQRFIDAKGSFVEPSFLQIEIAAAVSRATGDPLMSTLALSQLTHTSNMVFIPMNESFVEATIDIATQLD